MRRVEGLSVNVYRTDSFGDCSRNGLSAQFDELILIGPGIEGPVIVDLDMPPANLVKLVTKKSEGHEYMFVEPLDGQSSGMKTRKWYMAGGNFVYTPDSRFPNTYPLPVHDRHEG